MIGGAATQRQRCRANLARLEGAYLVQITARHGWARFYDGGNATRFADRIIAADDGCDVRLYDMSSGIVAVDWVDEPRFINGNLVDRC